MSPLAVMVIVLVMVLPKQGKAVAESGRDGEKAALAHAQVADAPADPATHDFHTFPSRFPRAYLLLLIIEQSVTPIVVPFIAHPV